MIRINLLGLPKPKKGKRGGAPAMAGAGPSPLIIALVVGVLAVGGNGGYYWLLTRERDRIAKEKTAVDAENKSLAGVKQKYDEAQKQRDIYKNRAKVIDDLRAKQAGPVQLLTTIADTVNATDAVWLLTVREEGNNINIEGTALSARAVANLIGNLRKTEAFKSVEIKETFQDDSVRDMQAFQFTLTCEKKQTQKS